MRKLRLRQNVKVSLDKSMLSRPLHEANLILLRKQMNTISIEDKYFILITWLTAVHPAGSLPLRPSDRRAAAGVLPGQSVQARPVHQGYHSHGQVTHRAGIWRIWLVPGWRCGHFDMWVLASLNTNTHSHKETNKYLYTDTADRGQRGPEIKTVTLFSIWIY